MKRILKAYNDIFSMLFKESRFIVIGTLISAIISGAIIPLSIWVNSQIFNKGLQVASGITTFKSFIPYILLFIVLALLPLIFGDLFIYSYVEPNSQLILRTAYKGKMLQKLKKLAYEHFENEESIEIIDKAYNRTENSVRIMFPMYVYISLSAIITTLGTLYLFITVKWWLLLTLLIPFIIETWLSQKYYFNIYDEMEKYWKNERSYGILANILKTRENIRENHLFQSSDFLIKTYRERLAKRNREYEKFYFKHLLRNFTQQNIIKIAQVGNALVLYWLYIKGELKIGLLITLTLTIFTNLFSKTGLLGCTHIFRWSGFHINTFDYYDKYFSLSEEEYGEINELPKKLSIEFDDVYFSYPGTNKPILKGLSFTVKHGEKISIVGENGEGKTTMIKLLLGLFKPDSGEIRIGGKSITAYSLAARSKIFGPVFQDFIKYSISLSENVGIGDIDNICEKEALIVAMKKSKVDEFVDDLAGGIETLLGRDFDEGVDLSGGQWQRIAIARAFMGNKPILILDEPTSQLDPMVESSIYSDFANISSGKTSIFITHRLGSTMITDRILVIAGGRVVEAGTHDCLMQQMGVYTDMFNAQKQWYIKENGGADNV